MAGIVDCAPACHGPTAVDMAHTRCNLMIDGSEAAERFLLEYQKGESSRPQRPPHGQRGFGPSRAAPHLLPSLVRGGNGDQSHPRTSQLATSIATNLRIDAPYLEDEPTASKSRPVRDGTPSKLNRRIEITRR